MRKKYTLLLGKVSTVCYFVFLKCMQTEKEQGDFLTTPAKQVLTSDVSRADDCASNNIQYLHGYTCACCYALFLEALAALVLLVLIDWVLVVVVVAVLVKTFLT